jgi:murein DD-endopeptidase MepM/ murein hydrolase activator NlpD
MVLLVALPLVGVAGSASRVRASSAEGTSEPKGRGLQLLGGREAILMEQSERARRAARARALSLYRLLQLAAAERGGGTAWPDGHAGDDRWGGRAVALATAVLDRDLAEARLLRAELDRVRAERAQVGFQADPPEAFEAPVPPTPEVLPIFLPPVTGSLVIPFGVARDPATGAWIFRAAASFATGGGEPVRSPGDGRVVRVAASVAGGAAVVVAHEQDRWTSVISGLDSVAVASGEVVRQGDVLGTGPRRPGSAVRIETWRGRTPIDPASVLRAY